MQRIGFLAAAVSIVSSYCAAQDDNAERFGMSERALWTTSRVVGYPDPPLPYVVERAFPEIQWERPIYAAAEPASNSLLVILQGGERNSPSRIVRVPDTADASSHTTLLEIERRLAYGLTFHPDFGENGFIYIFSNGPTGQRGRQNRISRYQIADSGTIDPATEAVILEWPSQGHDGGDLCFGRDGMLYITSGDGTSDSDTWLSAQDLSNLNGGVLRINVDQTDQDKAYSVPTDNPFHEIENARGELWAYGLRNPWRMCVDRQTGHIWVGNNGQDLWETVHFVRRGENYGWSVYEGNHPFYLNRQLGPTPFVKPTIEHHHIEARSLTGGVVYYGDQLPQLSGVYVYGDYSTGKIWGARHDGREVVWHRELADTQLKIAGFAVSHRQELLIVDHGGGLYRLVENPRESTNHAFPIKLSETGLFDNVPNHRTAPGVIPYSVNSPAWTDGARVDRYLGLPNATQVARSGGSWAFPDETVLMQTLSLPGGTTDGWQRIETRLLVKQQNEWIGYSYQWNSDQSDAELVDRQGRDVEWPTQLDGENVDASRMWHYPSRAECMSCHGRAAGFVLGVRDAQLNRDHNYASVTANQLRTLDHIGVFDPPLKKPASELPRWVDPYDTAEDLELRARTYLQVNCSSCHVEAGGGNSRMDFRIDVSRRQLNVLSVFPQHGNLGVSNGVLVAEGEPDRSILLQRLSRRGPGQMPPLGTHRVDREAVELFQSWIAGLTAARRFTQDWQMEDLLPILDRIHGSRSFAAGRAAFRDTGCAQCHRIGRTGGGAGPDLTNVTQRLKPAEILESLIDPSAKVDPAFAATVVHTTNGTSVHGRIERETEEFLVIRTSDMFSEPRKIPKDEIEEQETTPQSIMPRALLNSLEQEQILDLLAYVIAAGNRDHQAFASDREEDVSEPGKTVDE